VSAWRALLWWEARRVPFNIVVGLYGVLCLVLFFWAITTSGHLAAGEDAVEPMAVAFAPVGINVLYTLGWLAEMLARLIKPDLTPRFGPRLLKIGVVTAVVLCSAPPIAWVATRLAQAIEGLR
jgi:hypothetical protein